MITFIPKQNIVHDVYAKVGVPFPAGLPSAEPETDETEEQNVSNEPEQSETDETEEQNANNEPEQPEQPIEQ